MIVLITGGREYRNQREMFSVLDRLHKERGFTFLMHGDAKGADQMSHRWAKKNGVQPVAMEALWDFYGKSDGIRRNGRMLIFKVPDVVVAFDGGRGTANMMRRAHEYDPIIELIDVEDIDMNDPNKIVGIK